MKNDGTVRMKIGFFIVTFFLLIFFCYTMMVIYNTDDYLSSNIGTSNSQQKNEKYLIYTSTCRIPDSDPFNEDVRKFLSHESYQRCSKTGLLTYIKRDNDLVTLHINKSLLHSYSFFPIRCCYSVISRIVRTNKSDDEINFSECMNFDHSITISNSFIQVKCRTIYGEVYSNIHASLIWENLTNKQQHFKEDKPLSVLFVGIDSMSKLNLARTMPKTRKYLENKNFINLRGYTKIDDNTFPNLMAILTGKTYKQVYDHCNPNINTMNDCDIIWDRFRAFGYLTAYGEDETSLNTFNYYRLGFGRAPTDFYFRPYFRAAEKLKILKKHGMSYCTGPESSGERILNLAKDFTQHFHQQPKFSLWWTNTFSHDNINSASSMDEVVEKFLHDISTYLNNTVFIFFSDHGFRFGGIRYTYTGWLEERLPFIYVSIPDRFKEQYPKEYDNFLINSGRLTNPFDIYMTLQHVLRLTNDKYAVRPSHACPKCHSLFEEVNENRSCNDSAIEQHWCVCKGYSYTSPTKRIVKHVAQFIVDRINERVKSFNAEEGGKCAFYYLKNVVSAGMSEAHLNDRNQSVNYFLLMIETRPPAMFEGTVEAFLHLDNVELHMLGDISRLNRFKEHSYCVKDATLEKYCYCGGLFTSIKSAICNFSNCL